MAAVVENASVEALVSSAVEQAIAARRADLEDLVRSRVDVALQELAGELLDQQLARRCTSCGGFPVLPSRTVCRPCLRTRNRELHAARVARRRNGSAPDTDDEEPHWSTPDGARMPRRERVESPESAAEPAGRVNGCREPEHVEEHAAGISADELARRTGRHGVPALSGDELEAWLIDAGLAQLTSARLLVPTERAVEIAAALAS